MSTFEIFEITFIAIEFISIIVEICLQIHQIKSSKKAEQNILTRLNKNLVKKCRL